jgi:retinoblastoma-like protein 1
MNPAKWHACAAFVASGLEHASFSTPLEDPEPPLRARARASRSAGRALTSALGAFGLDCVDFFRALRTFMSAAATELTTRLNDAKSERRGGRREKRSRASRDFLSGGDGQHVGVETLEASLSVPEIRTSFAFTRVAAQKYKSFVDAHVDTSRAEGADVARFGWRAFLAAKHSTLPKFPDLFSCYHTLVAAEALVLVNAPPARCARIWPTW